MFGKLVKYDFKALNRIMVIMHAFLLITALIVRLTAMNNINFESSHFNPTTLLFVFIGCVLVFMTVSSGTYISIAVRFYKNLYSDEGYLSHTLPVTAGQHLLSKLIVGSVWATIDGLLITLSGYILFSTPYIIEQLTANNAEILKALNLDGISSLYTLVIFYTLYLIVCCFFSIGMIYLSIAIGQLFSGHHILASVVAYFSISTITTIIISGIMAVAGLLTVYANAFSAAGELTYNANAYMSKIFALSGILSAISIPLFYIITLYIMKRKRNLI